MVIPTHNRPELVRRAVASVLAQDYDGPISVTVVFDRTEPDADLIDSSSSRQVTVVSNERTPGLAGARNTGILSTDADLIAFCDDDDVWRPEKLTKQVARLQSQPGARFVTSAMEVDYADQTSAIRLAGTSQVTLQHLIRSRMSMLHSSSFLFVRSAMVGDQGFGLVDESMPGSMGEDWDLLLRAARHGAIEHVDEPLIRVLWGTTSYFNDVWVDKNAAHEWLLAHHPEFRADTEALGHMLGKLAFGHAALGHRRVALRYVAQGLRTNWREPRTPLALLVAAGVPSNRVLLTLNKRGHGI